MDLSWLELMSLPKLQAICKHHCNVPTRFMMTRDSMTRTMGNLPEDIRDAIRAEVEEEVARGNVKYRRSKDDSTRPQKRRRRTEPFRPLGEHVTYGPRLSDGAVGELNFHQVSPERIQQIIDSDFLRPPTPALVEDRLIKFIEASNNKALAQTPCASCARIRFNDDLRELPIVNLPHRELLVPAKPHRAHGLHQGMLLHEASLKRNKTCLVICADCFTSLKKNERPRFSLANNMWVGDIPDVLEDLTLPERMLIARYFPAAFIVKLFPKQKGSRAWDQSQMHNALRGNVSTYRLDPRQVAGLIDGEIYPPKADILSATIGITFVGPKGVREITMPQMFRVRRQKVRDALEWLQANNPLYSDIVISEDRLADLPADAVPEQLIRTAKYSSDIERVEREHAGYVPADDEDDSVAHDDIDQLAREAGLEAIDEDDVPRSANIQPESDPAIIPMQSLGVIDIEGNDISSSELFAHALSNTADPSLFPEDFAIRRGSAFVNEYARKDPVTGLRNDGGPSNANHLLGSFPCLFPYGQGGFEVARDVVVQYEAHARWAMEYHDKRFRKDPQFPFQVFGVMQKREVCRSAVLQMKKSSFARHIKLINTLTADDLMKASHEESKGAPFSHPGIRALRDEMAGVRTKVKGTDESRHTVRSKVWGTNLLFNAPTLWMTINPADTQNPIAQVFAGAEGIDLDAFCETAGPDHVQRATNVAQDPFASAQFFHFTVRTVFEQLFGVRKKGGGRVDREYGVLGMVQAYIGTVEAQGRGTLHLHMLLWLKDAPTAQEIKAALLSPEFREKMVSYIRAVVHADIDGKNKDEILAIPHID